LIISLVVAAIIGLWLGWRLRDHSNDSVESRAHRAAERMREAVRSLTR